MRLIYFLIPLLLFGAPARAAEFDFLKPYEGRWHGSAQTSFGPAALDLRVDLKNADKPVLEAKIKTNTELISATAALSGKKGDYMLELPYIKGEGPLHKIQVPLIVKSRDSGHELSLKVRESTETFNGSLWISDSKQDGAYKLEVVLPDGLRIAGIPLPLPPKLAGSLATTKYSASATVPVFPAIPLELKASRNAAPDTIDASGSFALYFFNCQLRKALPSKGAVPSAKK